MGKKKGIKHHEEYSIPDSDESEEEGNEDSDSSEDRSEDSDSAGDIENNESSGEESSEDEIEGGIDENSANEADFEVSEGGVSVVGEERSMLLRIAYLSFTLLSLVCYHRLYGNYFFG